MTSYCCARGNIVATSTEPGELLMRHQQREYHAHVTTGTITISCRCCHFPNVLVINDDGSITPQDPVFISPPSNWLHPVL